MLISSIKGNLFYLLDFCRTIKNPKNPYKTTRKSEKERF